ncbi:MAG: iron-sulfur cluster co-chaperone HscB C-terminal domain-containing protein, partial [Alphaproteobacteria bacterium]|nr:iron-sulfur cluster co-chaperone HscB C-terminal domain-containing protein [Alphaproteobacteria bacterium]
RQVLDHAFQKLQKTVHPDQHQDPLHKMAAQKLSSDISYYYHQMLTPMGCVDLLLQTLGLEPVEKLAQHTPSPQWAAYAFDIQEQLMDYTYPEDCAEIDACIDDINTHIGDQEKRFMDAFDEQNTENATKAAISLSYLLKLLKHAQILNGHQK